MFPSFLFLTFLGSVAHAQFPSAPNDAEIIDSALNTDVKISYKQASAIQVVIDICETTPGVRSFSGYVHLPESALPDLSIDFPLHTFFLYFEARNDPENAPLVIYLAGGPGESSTYAAMNGEGGPCYVNLDANSTTLNPWSLNNHANMLYIDQPAGAGFSYTNLINGTFSIVENEIMPLSAYGGDIPESNIAFGQGTYTDTSIWATTNTSASSAKALWHFAEHWLTQFPEYRSNSKKIGVWGNSHGGFWAPATAALFDKRFKALDSDSPLRGWTVDNIGITNGIIDAENDMPFWPEFAYNNTYQSFISEELYLSASQNFTKDGGCQDLIDQCRAVAQEGDPDARGTNETVSAVCQGASVQCLLEVATTIVTAQRSAFDIAVSTAATDGTDPCPYYLPVHTFLNQEWTQKALGVPLNFTYNSNVVVRAYTLGLGASPAGTGDAFRTDKSSLEYVLQNDIKVALVYGDRDARCPWTAAEHFSLVADYSGHESFNQAGYEYIMTNDSYQGGVVRQFEKFSFSRVFQAGHGVSGYQPETVEQIFHRTLLGTDVATGTKDATSGEYASQGPASSLAMYNGSLVQAPNTCMVLGAFQETSPWTPIFAFMAAQDEGGAGAGDETGSETGDSGSDSQEAGNNSTQSSLSVREQPGGVLFLSFWLFLAIGFGHAA